MTLRKKSFVGYIPEDWKIKIYEHTHMTGFHECIGIDSNIATKKGLENCSTGRKKVKVTIEEIK